MLRGERGITIVEMMAAMVISLLILGAGFTALISSQKATQVNDRVAQTQQNSRIAMELIARDIKMAGFGMTGPVGACNTGLVPNDQNPDIAVNAGGDSGPDSVRLVVPNTNTTIAPFWTLSVQAPGAVNTVINLQAGAVAAMWPSGLLTAGVDDVISIGGAMSSVVTAINVGADQLTLQTPIGAPKVFPVGTQIFMLQCVQYSIGTPAGCTGNAPCLVRNGVPLVEGIEDLQLAYACDGCNLLVNGGAPDGIPDDQNTSNDFDVADFVMNSTWTLAPLTADKIKLVQINIVARQTQQDQGLGETTLRAEGSDPAQFIVSDHDPIDDAGYTLAAYQVDRRRVLTRTVQTRNTGP